MKKVLLLLGIFALGSLPARADITSRFASSVQLSVGGAHTSTNRIGSSYAVSGSGVDTTITPTGGSAVTDGISGSITGFLYYTPPQSLSAGTAYVYQCTAHGGMVGIINIL